MKAPRILVVAAKRTAFGNFNGKLQDFTATDLAVLSSKSVLSSLKGSAEAVDTVVFGNVLQTSSDAAYLARHVGLRSGVPKHVPALTVNRLCGSGLEAVISGAQGILATYAQGRAEPSRCVLAGGTENMSQAPFVARGLRKGIKFSFGPGVQLEDSLATCLRDSNAGCLMGQTAETLASEYGINREACDAFAAASHANAAKYDFSREIVPVEVKIKKEIVSLDKDEGIRDVQAASLAKLPPVFGGVVTAANASGISDGAASVLLAEADLAGERGWRGLCEVIDWQVAGVDPARMGLGPVPAILGLLQRYPSLRLGEQIGWLEINEAFAPQVLAVQAELSKVLGVDQATLASITNLAGGAIALGHPLGASGARLVTHLAHRWASPQAGDVPYAIASACIGGGQGIAVLLKRPE